MLVYFDWDTTDYEVAFGTTADDDIAVIDAMIYTVEHCEACDEWTTCRDSICDACSWSMHETVEGCV